ncbi:MAG: glycosyltransferase [Planctomycetota bacterium]|jgi:hypothetical protein
MRIYHLIDTLDGEPSGPTLGLLRDLIAATSDSLVHRVIALGPNHLIERLQSFGLPHHQHLPVSNRSGLSAWWSLRRWARLEAQKPSDEPAVTHAWSLRGAGLAEKAIPNPNLITTLAHIPTPFERHNDRWSRAWRQGGGRCWALSQALGQWAAQQGVAKSRIDTLGPIIDPTQFDTAHRDDVRRHMGITDGIAVALLGDTPEGTDAQQGFGAVMLVEGTGLPIKMVADSNCRGMDRALHIMTAQNRSRSIVPTALMDRPWQALLACDIGLHLGGTLGLAWAMAAGLPIVSTGACGAGQWLEHGESGLIPEGPKAGHIARQIMILTEDSKLARRLGDNARQAVQNGMIPEVGAASMLELYQRSCPVSPA